MNIVLICDPATPNSKALEPLIAEHTAENTARSVSYTLGNDVETLKEAAKEAEVCIFAGFAGGKPGTLEALYPQMPKLKWIHALAAGVDNIVPILRECEGIDRIPVSNAKGAFSESLAEWCMAAFLHFDKQMVRVEQNRAKRAWDKFIMSELRGKTVGFVGFGSIAQATARLCKAFGMKVVALRRAREGPGSELADEVFTYDEDRLSVFQQSDFVVCSLPGTPQTIKFCGEAQFGAMKPSAVFVSIGRGVCVDEEALCEALKSKSILGAACDVFAVEPLPQESGLWDCENLLLTAHNADNTITYMADSWKIYRANFAHFENGKEIPKISLEHGY